MPKLIDTGLSKYYVATDSEIKAQQEAEQQVIEQEINQQEMLDQLILDNLNMQAQIDELILGTLS